MSFRGISVVQLFKFSKISLVSIFTLISFTTLSCEKNNLTNTNELFVQKSNNFIDWTKDRVIANDNFTLKSSTANLTVNTGNEREVINSSKLYNFLTGTIKTTKDSETIQGFETLFTKELRVGDKLIVKNTNEILTVKSIASDSEFTANEKSKQDIVTISNNENITIGSKVEFIIQKNTRAKSFGSVSVTPAIDLNGQGSNDDIIYFTSENSSGANLFSTNSSGKVIWERSFEGSFIGNSPTFSNKVIRGKKIMYIASSDGYIYCVNTDGGVINSIKTGDSFKNTSVWVDSSDPNADYIYAASQNGNFYRFKLDTSNSQGQSLEQEYKVKIADTKFSSSPVLSGSSIYLGGQNGVLYEIVPNSGSASRNWDLTESHNNGSSEIRGTPVVSGNKVFVPAGGYLFMIENSTVAQSPLLELTFGESSRTANYGSVFKGDKYPSGSINTSPIINPNTNKIYLNNANAVFEIDFSSIQSFSESAKYCSTISARLNLSGNGLTSNNPGNLSITMVDGNGASKIAVVDVNNSKNSTPFINFMNIPFNNVNDSLDKYLPFNDFNGEGYAVDGNKSRLLSDANGNVYFSLDNGTVGKLSTR